MKKIFFSLLALAVFCSSCEKDYLDTKPTDSVPEEDVFSASHSAWNALNGIHRLFYVQYFTQDQGGQGSMMINYDMLGEDLVMTAAGNGWYNSTYQWVTHRTTNASSLKFSYYFYYRVISNANHLINGIDAATFADADKKAIKGEALALRAWAYHNLVQMYGKRYDAAGNNTQLGVALNLTNPKEGLPRSTVEEVYTQINKDLTEAITNLEGYKRSTSAAGKAHINSNVAKGIKARVALSQGKWAEAAQLASEARQGFQLMSNAQYLTGFNDNSNPEWMWGNKHQEDQTTYFYGFFAYMSANFNSTNIRGNPKAINSKVYNALTTTDVRSQLWDPTGANTAFPIPPNGTRKAYQNRKFLAPLASSGISVGDVPYMRAAEMYLIEAEAKARLGQDGAAQDALFTLVKNRDASYTKSTNTGAALINEIMMHRRAELWGEGFRFFDLKRLNLPLDRTGANHTQSLAKEMSIPAGDVRWEFLIPQDEMNANKAMVQNPL